MPADVSRCAGAAVIQCCTDFWAIVDSLRVIRSSRAQQLATPLTRLINHVRETICSVHASVFRSVGVNEGRSVLVTVLVTQ